MRRRAGTPVALPAVGPRAEPALQRSGGFAATTGVRQLLVGVLTLDLLLAVLYLGTRTLSDGPWVLVHQFDLDGEATITAFYASAKWLLCAAVISTPLLVQRTRRDRGECVLCLLLLAFFVAMACDEIAQIHEWFGTLLDRYVVDRHDTAFPVTHFWMIVPVLGAAVFAVLAYRAMHRRSTTGAMLFLVGIGVMLTGGGGVEMLANFTGESVGLQVLQVAGEETLENVGASIALAGMVRYIADRGVRLELAPDARG